MRVQIWQEKHTVDVALPPAHGLWRCERCRDICSVIKYPGRIGLKRHAHCQFCDDITRQVVEPVEAVRVAHRRA